MSELHCLDATELSARIRERKTTSVEAVSAAIERIERLNGLINAVATPLFDAAMEQALAADRDLASGRSIGPLHGVPILIKDLFDFKAGVRNTFGCLATADFVPDESAAHVERLEAAGAIVLGKTNTPEFGHIGITDNLLFGPTSTPFDLSRNAGGSSGGSAAAVAAGMVATAQGSDAGGSVRIPAAWCGVFGFKPTYGRIPNTGGANAFGAHTPFVHVGPITRTVRDAALLTDVMSGPDPRDPFALPRQPPSAPVLGTQAIEGWKVAFSPDWGVFAVEPGIVAASRAAAFSLEESGAIVEDVDLKLPCSQSELAELWRRQVGVIYAEMFASFRAAGMDLLGEHGDAVPEDVQSMAAAGGAMLALDAKKDDWLRTQILRSIEAVFDQYTLLVTPTLSCSPVLNNDNGCTLGPERVAGRTVNRGIGWCLTHPVNFTGHPAASAPAGLSADGLPIGVQIVGRRFEDRQVLSACGALEQSRPWAHSYGPLWDSLERS